MASSYSVKKIKTEGRDKGKYGVYRDGVLLYAWVRKADAVKDKKEREAGEK